MHERERTVKMALYEYSWQKNELGQYCYTQTKKKKGLAQWAVTAIISLAVSAVIIAVFMLCIYPNLRPSAVISQSSGGPTVTERSDAGFVGLGEALSDSVVEVVAQSRGTDSFFGQLIPQYSTNTGGSGVVVTEDGYILTGIASIERENVLVRLADGTECEAALVGTDNRTGIAVLKIEKSDLKAVEFADSSALATGMSVAAVGRVLNKQLGITVTLGTVNGVSKGVSLQNGQTVNLFQTDAVKESRSGMLITDASGKAVGMVTGMLSSGAEGIELAVPSNDIVNALSSLISFGTAPNGLVIGITGIDTEHGVLIDSVGKDTPAERADLKKDDLIMQVDGRVVKSVDEINALKNEHQKGDTMTFTVYRDGEMLSIEVQL